MRRKKKRNSKDLKTRRFSKKIKEKSKRLKTRKFIASVIMLSNESKINAAKLVEIEKRVLNAKKTTLIIFCFNVIFFVKVDFFSLNCELILSNSRKIHIREYHLRSSEISVKTFHYFSIKNRTQDTTLFFENEEIKHAFHFLVQAERARRQIMLIAQIIRVFRVFKCVTL